MSFVKVDTQGGIKSLLRGPVAEGMLKREKTSIADFVEVWYTETTQACLQGIKIH